MVSKFGFEVAFGNLRKGNFSLLARRLMDKVGQGAAPRRKLEKGGTLRIMQGAQ